MSPSKKLFTCVLGVALFAACWIGMAHLRRDPLNEPFYMVDADVPGTETYFRDKLLGVAPVHLSKNECLAMGLIASTNAFVDSDGWGEGIPFNDLSSNTYMRVMYKVPAYLESNYFIYETPWGLRTKNAGGYKCTNGFQSIMMSKSRWPKGFSVQIDVPSTASVTNNFLKVTASLTNLSTNVIAGFRPQLEMHWGTLDVQWLYRNCMKFPLPNEWGTIHPGQSLKYEMRIPVPKSPGDYSVFATFDQFKDETSGYGAFGSDTDSHLLHVR